MRAWSLEGRALLCAAALACGCGNVISIDDTGGGGSTSAGGGGATTTSGMGGAGGSAGEGGSGAGGSTSTTSLGCKTKEDCVDDPHGPICNVDTGKCVACFVVADPALDCGIGSWCDGAKGQCEIGCTGKEDCPTAAGDLLCDIEDHTCKHCMVDTDCPAGSICAAGECVAGCSQEHACPPGVSCCGGECHDLATEVDHCGACNFACPTLPWMVVGCMDGQCVGVGCEAGHADCDGQLYNGCEQNALSDGPCVCQPGAMQGCYLGSPTTEGVGACKAGTRTCNSDGVGWGPCQGQVLPAPEICANGVDENCNGLTDENVDLDGDGWGTCEGDCNDLDPKVNPGAIEVNPMSGNGKDDDCDPATPDVGQPPPCSTAVKLTGVTANELAAAMELCKTTAASPPKPQKTWGLISAQLLRADGSAPGAAQLADMMDKQVAVLGGYGVSAPKVGATMVGLSTGMMRDLDDPGAVPPSPGTDLGWAGSPPADYLAAHFGALPANSGCSGVCPSGAGANDGVTLRVVVRVPTNMAAFSFDYRVFTAGYPGAVCSAENDFFLGRLTSGEPVIPQDKNIVYDGLGNTVSMNNAFFEVCAPASCFTCPKGSSELAGTGMSAATAWLVVDAPVKPGETITLDLTVFDVSTGLGDWVALVDGFRWHPPSGPSPI